MYMKGSALAILILLQIVVGGCTSVYGDGGNMLKMTFVWEGKEEEQRYRDEKLEVKIEYEDPVDVSIRLRDLKGSRVLPFHFEVKNISKRKIDFRQNDIILDIGVPLNPESVDTVIEAIEESGKPPSFFDKVARILPRSTLPIRDRRQRILSKVEKHIRDNSFKYGEIKPGKKRKGLIFFMLPEDSPYIHTAILRSPIREPQIIEVKGVKVKTNSEDKSFKKWFAKFWKKYIKGEPQPFNKSYALVVGIGEYKYLEDLESPAADVMKMVDFLHKHQKFDEVIYFMNEEVTKPRLMDPESILKEYINERIKKNDRFLFYYSGHGISQEVNGETCGYLPLANVEGNNDSNNMVSMSELVSWMDKLKCIHLMVVLDCCFSGLATRDVKIENRNKEIETKWAEFDYKIKINKFLLDKYSKMPARYLITAGDDEQVAIASKKYWKGSLFTDAFIRGAKKEADSSKDKIIIYGELYAWLPTAVSNATIKVNMPLLVPQFKDLGVDGAISEGQFFFLRK